MLRMKAAGIDAFGGEVQLLELDAPAPPARDEIVISVRAAGVGNWDEIVRVGDWDVGRRPPLALGVEAAGVVAAVGEDVTSLAPGDEVLTHPVPLRHQGTWAERLVAPAALVARKPAAVPWAAAAAFPVPALAADQALTEAAPVRPEVFTLPAADGQPEVTAETTVTVVDVRVLSGIGALALVLLLTILAVRRRSSRRGSRLAPAPIA